MIYSTATGRQTSDHSSMMGSVGYMIDIFFSGDVNASFGHDTVSSDFFAYPLHTLE